MDSIQVEIFGQTYNLKGGAEAEYIRQLAAFVNSRMREIQKGMGTSEGYRIAILAALNIADELHRVRSQHEELRRTASASLDRIIDLAASEK